MLVFDDVIDESGPIDPKVLRRVYRRMHPRWKHKWRKCTLPNGAVVTTGPFLRRGLKWFFPAPVVFTMLSTPWRETDLYTAAKTGAKEQP